MKEYQRPLTQEEEVVLKLLLNKNFKGIDVLRQQISNIRVVGICGCGCRTIDLEIIHKGTLSQYKENKRVPVELELKDTDGCPIMVLLHVVEGYIAELEILRADSQPIQGSLKLEGAIITIN